MTETTLTWVLVADSSQARLYSMHKAKIFQEQMLSNDFHLISEFAHEASRKKGAELVTDKMGEFGSGTFVEATSPKQHEAEQFAHQLLAHLETARKMNKFRDIILVAPSAFMGILCKHMQHELKKFISQRIEKDYIHLQDRQLLQALINHL